LAGHSLVENFKVAKTFGANGRNSKQIESMHSQRRRNVRKLGQISKPGGWSLKFSVANFQTAMGAPARSKLLQSTRLPLASRFLRRKRNAGRGVANLQRGRESRGRSKMAAKVAKVAVFQNRHLRTFSFMFSFFLSMFSDT
jgi:hypothetical protein